jgi:hypothetical protein
MAESNEEIAKQLGMTVEQWREVHDADKNRPFVGKLEFEIVFDLFGERVTRRARVDYRYTPDWEYLDPKILELRKGWEGAAMGFELLTVPNPPEDDEPIVIEDDHDDEVVDDDDEDPSPPAWVKFAIVGEGILPRSVWDRIDDAIDEKCKAEDQERRRRHGK